MIPQLFRAEFANATPQQIDIAKELFPSDKLDTTWCFALVQVSENDVKTFSELSDCKVTSLVPLSYLAGIIQG